jgi:hypothetical protein
MPVEAVLQSDGFLPDVELRGAPQALDVDWIHRRGPQLDIYFLANLTEVEAEMDVAFRVADRTPEIWDAVSGSMRELPEFRVDNGQTVVPLQFAAKQSWFVVFRKAAESANRGNAKNFPALRHVGQLSGPWTVSFDKKWGGPDEVVFQHLDDWSKRPEPSIRYYSGTATYRNSFRVPREHSKALWLGLGEVKNLAEVRVNGHSAGIVWTAPWRVDIGKLLRAGRNELEIEVVNLWPNRLIGDGDLPEDQRYTKTNVRTYEHRLPADFSCWWDPACVGRKKSGEPAELLSSGLLGPVVLLSEDKG